jgi:hypothetical protein
MSSVAGIADWIKRLAEDERKRDALRVAPEEQAGRRADLILRHRRHLVSELQSAILRDVKGFRSEFPDDPSREIVLDATKPDGGFVVRKPAAPPVSLRIDPHLEAGTIACCYRFTSANGLPPRDYRFKLSFAANGDGKPQLTLQGTWRVFPTADAVSEFLLVPVFTGRAR